MGVEGLLEIGDRILKSRDLHHVEIVNYGLPGEEGYQLVQDEETGQQVLGISKKALVGSFIGARDGFFNTLGEWKQHRRHYLSNDMIEFMNKCSIVILLIASEHNTVLNWRKERILDETDATILGDELNLVRVLVSSPLKKHSKSPLLWHHRKWLIERARSIQSVREELWCIDTEIDIILIAAENHPANYYAWNYCRRVIECWSSSTNSKRWINRFVEFCYAHPSDISAWTFLFFFINQVLVKMNDNDDDVVVKNTLCSVYEYATCPEKGGYAHDSVWTFLRLCIVYVNNIPRQNREHILNCIKRDYPNILHQGATTTTDNFLGNQKKQMHLVESFYEFVLRQAEAK